MKIDNNRILLGSCQIAAFSSSSQKPRTSYKVSGSSSSRPRVGATLTLPETLSCICANHQSPRVTRPDAQLDSSASGVMGPEPSRYGALELCFLVGSYDLLSKLYRGLIRTRLMVLRGFLFECSENKATKYLRTEYLTVISEGTVAPMSLDMRG